MAIHQIDKKKKNGLLLLINFMAKCELVFVLTQESTNS